MLLTIHIAVAVGVLGTDIVLLTLASPALPAPTRSSSTPATSPWGYSRPPSCSPGASAANHRNPPSPRNSWGLARHWWVTVKLVLTIGLATAAVFVLRPALNRAAAQALPMAELPTTGIGPPPASR